MTAFDEQCTGTKFPGSDTNDRVIVVTNLYKRYTRNEYRPSLRHEMGNAVQRLLGKVPKTQASDPFYALKDISFSIKKGEAVAIIGRNGSGKTTLLRVLSGITKPSSGMVEVRGRFASLIALGAGFNPEMTGRENIYLNAAMQGVSPSQVKPVANDIIEFADIGTFIDLPVKRYSSGMHARLGFSIALHIAPDIIFVDEILAVGDAAFQEKCNQRILDFRAEGRTFLVVTHNPKMVKMLCDRVIWLEQGEVRATGYPDEILPIYGSSSS
jgi:lipopolysaccharide transport system ATP-binding protein